MKTTDYAGIDYGLGKANIDLDNGIRYGVIHHATVGQVWYDESEPDYGEDDNEEAAEDFEVMLDAEPLGYYIEGDEVTAYQGQDSSDIFVTKSLYYTRAQYCSPCCPGAGNLDVYCPTGPKTYCFGHDWFEEGIAPYLVYRVDNDELVLPPLTAKTICDLVNYFDWAAVATQDSRRVNCLFPQCVHYQQEGEAWYEYGEAEPIEIKDLRQLFDLWYADSCIAAEQTEEQAWQGVLTKVQGGDA